MNFEQYKYLVNKVLKYTDLDTETEYNKFISGKSCLSWETGMIICADKEFTGYRTRYGARPSLIPQKYDLSEEISIAKIKQKLGEFKSRAVWGSRTKIREVFQFGTTYFQPAFIDMLVKIAKVMNVEKIKLIAQSNERGMTVFEIGDVFVGMVGVLFDEDKHTFKGGFVVNPEFVKESENA